MKKYIFIAFTALLTYSLPAFSQDDEDNFKRFNIGFNVGLNTPKGTFSRDDSVALPYMPGNPSIRDTNTINGYAKSGGFHFNAYVTYMLTMRFGAMLAVGGNFNSFDVSTLTSNADAEYAGNGFGGTPPSFSSSGSYYVGEYLLGPYCKFQVGPENLYIEGKALLGAATANYPTLTYSYTYMGTTATQTEVVKTGTGLCYTVGCGVKYSILNRLIGLHLGVAYTGSSITYPGVFGIFHIRRGINFAGLFCLT